jgi:hypothetical protein
MQVVLKSQVEAAVALARSLRCRGLVAAESAGTDGVARVLVFSRTSAQLAEQIHVIQSDNGLCFQWAEGESIGSVSELERTAQKIVDMLTA